jgi:excisionase family DNA binding protein
MISDPIAYLNTLGPKLLGSRETADILGCHTETLYRWVKAGLIPHIRVGGRVKFSAAAIEEYLQARAV